MQRFSDSFHVSLIAALVCLGSVACLAVPPAKTIGGDWPQFRHDARLTGLSPLKGGLEKTPRELWSVELGGPMVGAESVRIEDVNGDGKTEVLRVQKDRIICQDLAGKKLWEVGGLTKPNILDIRDYAGDGGRGLLTESMDGFKYVRSMIDGKTGERAVLCTIENMFGGSDRTGHILPGVPGQQYCVWWSADEIGFGNLWSFENGPAKPTIRFQKRDTGMIYAPIHAFVDIDGDGQVDMLMVGHEKLWAYDLKSQQLKFTTCWRPDGRIRSYSATIGVMPVKPGKLPSLLIISPHVPGVEVVEQDGKGALHIAWKKVIHPIEDQYQMDQTIAPGAPNPFMDLDGDGEPEILAIITNEHNDARTRLSIFAAASGERRFDEPDISVLGVDDLDGDGKPEVLLKNGEELSIANWTGKTFATRWKAKDAQAMFRPVPPEKDLAIMHGQCNATLWREQPGSSSFLMRFGPEVWSCRLAPGGSLEKVKKIVTHEALGNVPLPGAPTDKYTWNGKTLKTQVDGKDVTTYELTQQRMYLAPPPIVGELDGHTKVLVTDSEGKLLIVSADGKEITKSEAHPPVSNYEICDLDGDGRNEILASVMDADGKKPILAMLDAQGKITRQIDVPGAKIGALATTGSLGAGQGRWIVVKVNNGYETPSVVAFDGKSGKMLWHREKCGSYGPVPTKFVMHFPTAVYDYNKDGADDLLALTEKFYTIIDVKNNKELIDPIGKNIALSNIVPGHWTAYAVPVIAPVLGTDPPQVVLCHSYTMALFVIDMEGWPVWHYGTTRDGTGKTLAGVADMDGDGKMELVSARGDGFLQAFDAQPSNEKCSFCPKDVELTKFNHAGHVRWDMQLTPPISDFASADLDGDGKVEVLCGSGDGKLYAIKDVAGKPTVLWTVDFQRTVGSPILADLDSDGQAKILVTTEDGRLHALHQ